MDKKFVINIGRELGSGGRIIGERVAGALGIDFYDKELLHLASKSSGISDEIFESVDENSRRSTLSTLVSYLRNPFSDSDAMVDSPLSAQALFEIQSQAIRDVAAQRSALFVGRCADYVLRDHSLVINIFISAALEDRIARIAQSEGIEPSEAKRIIEKCDASRASYYNYYTTREWGKASTYDLCINSSMLGIDSTVECLLKFIERRLSQE